jgi:peptidyl-prolyl cis-trans isomerase D
MLKLMRDSSKNFLIYLMFGVLVFVFAVSFGPGGNSCDGVNVEYAARVDGEVIRPQDFGLRFQNQLDYLRRSGAYGAGANDKRLQEIIRKQVIDQLVEARVLSQEASRRGLSVTDDELLEYLGRRYQVKASEYDVYASWVNRSFGMTVKRFEELARAEVAAERLQKLVTETVAISDNELRTKFFRERDRAKVDFVRFSPDYQDLPDPTSEQLSNYVKEHTDEIKKKYEEESFKYRIPKQVRARQILKALPKDASDELVAKARQQLAELKIKIEAGEDFAALAKTGSDDEATRYKGGDLGFIQRGDMARELVDKLYVMNKDALTNEPVRTRQGLHLLQVTEITPPSRKKLDDVQEDIVKTILREQFAAKKAKEAASGMLAKLGAGDKFKKLTWLRSEEKAAQEEAEKTGASVKGALPVRNQSAWILKNQVILPGIGASPSLHTAIFSLDKTQTWVDSAHLVGEDYVIARLSEREKPDEKTFEGEKASLREQAVWDKRSKVLQSWIKHLKDQATIDLNPNLFPPTTGLLPGQG